MPKMFAVLEKMVVDPKIGKFCKNLLDIISQKGGPRASIQGEEALQESLREIFLKWVSIQYIDDVQEKSQKL